MVQLGEEKAQRRPYISPEILERTLWQGEGLPLLPDDSDQMRGNGLELCQGRLRMEISKNIFSEKVVMHLHRLPGEVVVSKVFEQSRNMVLWDAG